MIKHAALAAVFAALVSLSGSAQQRPDAAAGLIASIEARQDHYATVAKQIWDYAELGFQEEKSSALLQKTLADAGFAVATGVAGMPTAFTASYGTGRPVIVIVGEFDALPGLSQAAGEVARRPLKAGAPGHGCGHNLFGTASAAAAIAVKDWLAAGPRTGTVRYFGTPAEEGGGGKIYMLREGLLKDVDAVIGWHPSDQNSASPSSSLATVTAEFTFHGTAAHAAAAPDRGRSALDGIEAMNYMVNLMREHVPQETRLHYVIREGGVASNIVPDRAVGIYQARHPDMRVLQGIWDRVVKAAEGAALGTGTRVEHEVVTAYWNVLPNETLAAVQHRSLTRVGGVTYTPEEQAFAERIRPTLISPTTPIGAQSVIQPIRLGFVGSASTDMGDLSWNVPTVQMTAATFSPGVPAHTWQAVACAGMSIGVKGMLVAAKTMAITAADLIGNPDTLAKAREEFLQKRGGADFKYTTIIGDRKPPFDYRKGS